MTIRASGTLGIHTDINAERPNYGNDIGAYHGKNWWLGGQYPATTGVFGAGQLLMSEFYNKRFTAPIPHLADQDIALPNTYPFGGCAGAGWSGAAMHIRRSANSYFTCTTRCNDYSCQQVDDNVVVASPSNFYDSGGNPTNYYYIFQPGGWGRDATSWIFYFDFTGITWNLRIVADCKGGGRGWGHGVMNQAMTSGIID